MKLNEIVLGENQTLVPEILNGIQEIAQRLMENDEDLYRRELVWELNDLIPNLNLTDGRIINSLVKDAYHQTNSSAVKVAISKRIIENKGNKCVYDPYRISDTCLSLKLNDDDNFNLDKFNKKTEILKGAIDSIGKADPVGEIYTTESTIHLLVPEDNFSLTGRTKVNDTFNYARKIYDGYGNLINQYKFAQQRNLDLIEDFELLRDELKNFREDITQLLSEISGQDIQVSHPYLFDFSKIEYFDIEEFRGELNLAFDELSQKMQIFNSAYNNKMLELKESGIGHADKALDRLSKTKKRRGQVSSGEIKGQVAVAALGFAFDAFISISETRKSAEETVAQLKHDVEVMKLGLKGDSQIIVDDLLRLGKLHSRLNTKLIPGVKKFIIEATKIYNSIIKNAYSEMVKGGTLYELSSANRNLIAEKKQIELEIEDKNQGIIICEDEISKYDELISEIMFEYNYVIEIKPNTPNLFHTIISFGIAKTEYEKHLEDWIRITEPIRTKYGIYVNLRNLEEETLIKFNDVIEKLHNRVEEIQKQHNFNKIKIEEQSIRIEDFTPQFEAFTLGIKQLSSASKNFLEIGIAEDLSKISHHAQPNFDEFAISNTNSNSTSIITNVDYLNNERYKMDLKLELLSYSEFLITVELVQTIKELSNEKVENFISDQMFKLKSHLTSKIQQKTQLNSEQTNRLVNLGADIFMSILKTQKIKAETNFLKEINNRLDHEFSERFETSIATFKHHILKDQHDAETLESALNDAMSIEDLLKASESIKSN